MAVTADELFELWCWRKEMADGGFDLNSREKEVGDAGLRWRLM
jgi:hypothetical protein